MTSFLIIFGPKHSGTNSHSKVNPVALIGYIFPTIEASFYIEHGHGSNLKNNISFFLVKHAMAQLVVLTASSVSKSKLEEEDCLLVGLVRHAALRLSKMFS